MENLNELTIEEKVGQMLMVGIENKNCIKSVEYLIEKYKIGGVLLYKRDYKNYKELNELINRLRALGRKNKVPLFIAIDQEGGRVNRMPDEFGNLPSANKLALYKEEDLVEKSGEITGEMLRSVGFNFNFAPVLDIKRFGNTQAIGDRAFSDDVETVSRCGITYMNKMKEQHIVPAIKHYPGHGATKKDSHFTLPVIEETKENLEQEDLVPFKRAIECSADVLLVGHLRIKKVTHCYPASMSKSFVRKYIRKKNRFNGIVITDDIRMKAVKILYGTKRALIKAFKAGNDIILFKYNTGDEALIDKILKEVNDGKINIAKINRSVRRILKVKEKYEIENEEVPYLETLPQEIKIKMDDIKNKIKGKANEKD